MANEAFYSTIAGLIPVLLLALVVEHKIFGTPDDDEPAALSLTAVGIIVSMAFGELFALSALFSGKKPQPIENTVIFVAVVLPFLAFVVGPIRARLVLLGRLLPVWFKLYVLMPGTTIAVAVIVVLTTIGKISEQAFGEILAWVAFGLFAMGSLASNVSEIRRKPPVGGNTEGPADS